MNAGNTDMKSPLHTGRVMSGVSVESRSARRIQKQTKEKGGFVSRAELLAVQFCFCLQFCSGKEEGTLCGTHNFTQSIRA